MKRTILTLTTAMALALPAAAQTDVEETVMEVLADQGYSEKTIDMLSEGQIANLYITATSEDGGDIATVIDGFNLPQDEATEAFYDGGMTELEDHVRNVLETNGYSADIAASLSSSDLVTIYEASAAEGSPEIVDAIDEAINANATLADDDPSQAEERAVNYLMTRGFSRNEIENADQAELVALYVALTSGDAEEIDQAVTVATGS